MEILREGVKILKTKILTGNQVWHKYLEFQEGLGEGEGGSDQKSLSERLD